MSTIVRFSKVSRTSLGKWCHDIQRGLIKLLRFQQIEMTDRARRVARVAACLPAGQQPDLHLLWQSSSALQR